MASKRKLCLATSGTFPLGEKEQLEKFKRVGINGFFSVYKSDEQIFDLCNHSQKLGLFFQSIHAMHLNMRGLWFDENESNFIAENFKKTIACAHSSGVDRVVMHLYCGFLKENPTKLGINKVSEILETAYKYGVKLCFENLEGANFLEAVLDEFKDNPYARFCYDTGHENCYLGKSTVEKYIDRISVMHINDNLGVRMPSLGINGKDDLHLLPFDGKVDFDRVADIVIKAGLKSELTFELKISKDEASNKYRQMSFDEYLDLAFSRMKKFANLVDNKLCK